MPEPLDDPPPPTEPVGSSGGVAGEEVLEAGARAPRSRNRRLREQLLLAAVILALVAAVARAMSHHNDPTATPTTGPSTSTASRGAPDTGSGLLNGSVVDVTGAPDLGPDDVGDCPATYQCLEADEPGPGAVAALVAAFPSAVLESTTTIRLLSPNFGQPLWYRQITGRFGPNRILVRVQRQRPQDLDRHGVAESEFGVITYYEGRLSKYHVVVQVTTPKGHVQSLSPVQKLAQDVRLLRLS